MKIIHEFWRDEQGAVLAEYGLLLAVVSTAAIASVQSLSNQIVRLFELATQRLGELVVR